MKEIAFIHRNKARWSAFEQQLKQERSLSPDALAAQYILLTDDLSYARTFYPQSGVVAYLNALSARTHGLLYSGKKEPVSRLLSFWTKELPLELYYSRHDFLWALLLFLGAALIGWVSVFHESDFIRYILGDAYVDQTLDNIAQGNPMGIYDQPNAFAMFFLIAINNIRVSFLAFLFGLFTPVGTGFILLRNGIMVGAFLAFFFEQSLGLVSLPTILLHGTIELSAIVLAGGAGILLGRSILFPGTYPRAYSFWKAARRGVKIILGLLPYFVLAAFLEAYLTRHYQSLSQGVTLFVIAASFLLILFYFVVYPRRVYLQTQKFKPNE